MKPGNSPNIKDPQLSYQQGINIGSRNTSTQSDSTAQHSQDANRLAKVPNRPSEGTAPLSNKLPPLPLP